jgi:hypothetical protein
MHIYNNQIKRVDATASSLGVQRTMFQYENGKLTFAYYEEDYQLRLYFKDDALFRMRYTDSSGKITDFGYDASNSFFTSWEDYTLKGGYDIYSKAVSVLGAPVAPSNSGAGSYSEIEQAYGKYILKFVEAANSRNYSLLTDFIIYGSQMHEDQEESISDYLTNDQPDMKEDLISCSITSHEFNGNNE